MAITNFDSAFAQYWAEELLRAQMPFFNNFQWTSTMNPNPQQAHPMTQDGDLPNLTILIKLLKMTTSTNDGEALNAMRMANNALTKFGGDWERLLRGKVTVIGADPFDRIPDPPRAPPPAPKPQAPPQTHTQKQQWKPSPPPPPPPRPTRNPNLTTISQEPLIASYFDVLEFVTLNPTVQVQINSLAQDFKYNKYLSIAEFSFLESTATPHIRQPRKHRGRGTP